MGVDGSHFMFGSEFNTTAVLGFAVLIHDERKRTQLQLIYRPNIIEYTEQEKHHMSTLAQRTNRPT